MSAELIGALIFAGIGILTIGAFISHRAERLRDRRVRSLASTGLYLQRCWSIADSVPGAYLPNALRRLLGRFILNSAESALKLDPNNPYLQEQVTRGESWIDSIKGKNPATDLPLLTPQDRKSVSQGLRDLKRMVVDANRQGVLTDNERTTHQSIIDGLVLRLMVDHLKVNGYNCESIGRYEDGIGYLTQAAARLQDSNAGGRYQDELSEIVEATKRMRTKQRTSTPPPQSSPLARSIEEEKRAEQEVRPASLRDQSPLVQ